MAIPLNLQIKPTARTIENTDITKANKADWIVWWYGGLHPGKPDSQPKAAVLFRRIGPEGLSNELIRQDVALTSLGQMRIGTIWREGRCHSEAVLETTGKVLVDFTAGTWTLNSFHEAARRHSPEPFPQSIYPLQYPRDRNWMIEFPIATGGKLVMPCLEFFSRCYGRSQEIKRILATYPWDGAGDTATDRLYAPLEEPEEPGKWKISLRKRLYNGDAVFLAHAKYDLYTQAVARAIHTQLTNRSDTATSALSFLQTGPWFQGTALLKVRGLWFEDRKSFLALQIVGCSDPGGVPIDRSRENTNLTGPLADGAALGKAWEGAPENRLVKPPEIVNLTGEEEPDAGTATVEITDPDFEVLGEPRVVIDIRRKRARSTHGTPGDGGSPSTFSSGERSASGNGTGFASIHAPVALESEGALRDVWNALLDLPETRADMVRSVEWFMFGQGFQSSRESSLISLEPFDESTNEKIEAATRNWPYYDVRAKRLRGVLVARIQTRSKPVYILEIERRPVTRTGKDGKPQASEQSFKGLVFQIEDQTSFPATLQEILAAIRGVRGIVDKLVHRINGRAATFRHPSSGKDAHLAGEAAVRNALTKIGIEGE